MKNTWKKYRSAFNSFQEFCLEEKIQNPWPLTKKHFDLLHPLVLQNQKLESMLNLWLSFGSPHDFESHGFRGLAGQKGVREIPHQRNRSM